MVETATPERAIMLSDPMEGHTAKAFDAALTQLRLHTVGMGGLVIDQVSTAVRALLDAGADRLLGSWRELAMPAAAG